MGGRNVVMIAGSILSALVLTGLLLAALTAEAGHSTLSVREWSTLSGLQGANSEKSEMPGGVTAIGAGLAAQASLSPSLLVDDFHDITPTNELGGDSGWPEPFTRITCTYPGGMLCCDYDVSPTSTYALYWTELLSTSLAGHNSLSFQVKGDVEGELARAELKDCAPVPNYPKLRIEDYTAQPITASWQQVTMPLVGFSEVDGWNCLDKFAIRLDNAGGNGKGTICLDNIWFEPTWAPVVVDDFDDCQEPNALNGESSKYLWGTGTMGYGYTDTIRMGDVGCAQWITYAGVTLGSYAVWQTELKGLDASEYGTLAFHIKGSQGGEESNVYLQDAWDPAGRGYEDITVTVTTVDDDWQRVFIPLQRFSSQGVSLTNLSVFQLAFEWTEMTGMVYLDDIQFIPHTIYLPLVTKNYHRFCNGGFETCDFTCWSHGGELNRSVRFTMPHTGNCAALLGDPGYDSNGGVPVGSAWMCQSVSVSSVGSPTLSFWYRIYSYDVITGSDGVTLWDSFDVYVNENLILRDGGEWPPGEPIDDTGWRLKTYDLTTYRGEPVELCFYNRNRRDGWHNTWTWVDDVTVME